MRARFIDRRKNLTTVRRAYVCALGPAPSFGLLEKSISRSTLNVPRGEISGNWPYEVHISALVTRNSAPLVRSAGAQMRARGALSSRLDFFFHGRDEISGGGSVDRVPLGELAWRSAYRSSQDSRGSRVTGQVGRSLRQEGEGEEGCFRSSSCIYPKYRHLPPPPTSPPHPVILLSCSPLSVFSCRPVFT